jgi:stage II sporulation protein D
MDRGDFLEKKTGWRTKKKKLLALGIGIGLLLLLLAFGEEKEEAGRKEDRETETQETEEAQIPETIRVLLKNSDYTSIYHDQVRLTSDGMLQITQGQESQTLATGEAFCLQETGEGAAGDCIQVEGGTIRVESIRRSQAAPVYEGKLEIYPTDQGYVLVNEVDFETYVKGVLPGEMPASYETEALKAQAVCARTYGAMKLENGPAYEAYEADLDDSVQYQVYKSQETDERTDRAVEDTKGEVLTYNGEIAAAYYFSTSWGYTTGMDAWLKEETAYLGSVAVGTAEACTDFETAFKNPQGTFYEAKEPWYRWKVQMNLADCLEEFYENLKTVQADSPDQVLVYNEEQQAYEEKSLEAFSQVKSLQIAERGSGGVALALELVTENQKIEVQGQHAIRRVLAFKNNQILRQDGSVVKNFSLLPSGFFLLETVQEGETVQTVVVEGGGFGHGVGMSQNGANQMALLGKDYLEILSYFYPGTETESRK